MSVISNKTGNIIDPCNDKAIVVKSDASKSRIQKSTSSGSSESDAAGRTDNVDDNFDDSNVTPKNDVKPSSNGPHASKSRRRGSKSPPNAPSTTLMSLPPLPWLPDNSGFASDSGNQVATSIRRTFEKHQDPNGWAWRHLSRETIEIYWQEFQKQWSWNPAITSIVRREWEKKAKVRYKDLIHIHRRTYEADNTYKPTWATTTLWNSWIAGWNSAECSAQRTRNATNRRRGKAERNAESTHTGGSVSHLRTLRILEKENRRAPTSYELFTRTHRVRTKDGLQWVNDKAQMIHDEYTRRIAALPDDAHVDDLNAIYLDIVQNIESEAPKKKSKKAVYGVGSAAQHLYTDIVAPQSQYTTTPPPQVNLDERLSQIDERIQKMEDDLSRTMKQEQINTLIEEQRKLREDVNHLLRFIATCFQKYEPPPPSSPK
ncbi:unnamed protein product [Amaranthus hypochondriacus]